MGCLRFVSFVDKRMGITSTVDCESLSILLFSVDNMRAVFSGKSDCRLVLDAIVGIFLITCVVEGSYPLGKYPSNETETVVPLSGQLFSATLLYWATEATLRLNWYIRSSE